MACRNLAYIERQLRLGKTPEELGGKEIGRGVCKAAYFFDSPAGGFVVKLNAQDGFAGIQQKTPPKKYLVEGARAARTYKAGRYIIQERVKVLDEIIGEAKNEDYKEEPYYKAYKAVRKFGDCHSRNVGVGKDGMLVVFDW